MCLSVEWLCPQCQRLQNQTYDSGQYDLTNEGGYVQDGYLVSDPMASDSTEQVSFWVGSVEITCHDCNFHDTIHFEESSRSKFGWDFPDEPEEHYIQDFSIEFNM